MHNIEKSGFRKGQYVGYADGVWIIAKGGAGWRAMHRENKHPSHTAATLADISAYLDSIKPKTNPRRKSVKRKTRRKNPPARRSARRVSNFAAGVKLLQTAHARAQAARDGRTRQAAISFAQGAASALYAVRAIGSPQYRFYIDGLRALL